FICSESRLLRWAVLKILMYAVYTPVFRSVRLVPGLLTTINRGAHKDDECQRQGFFPTGAR
ncbi:MAG: hypothetical protein JW989_00750, partial [Chlorobiaceae bacterium]|nr:hypothetical protein [Chlorobiaceae bacterium]